MTQWHLIKIACNSQLKVSKATWINSFVKVNLHPKHRLSFGDWIAKLDEKGILESGKKFLKDDGRLFDAMPAFWRCMSIESRQEFFQVVNRLYKEEPIAVWTAENVVNFLVKYLSLSDMDKARACYLACKQDPLVICTTEKEHAAHLAVMHKQNVLILEDEEGKRDAYFYFKPTKLLNA